MSEEQAQQLMQQMQMLETYFTDLSQREGTLLSVLREAISAIESIKSLREKPNSDTLVPIGMGTYVLIAQKLNIPGSKFKILCRREKIHELSTVFCLAPLRALVHETIFNDSVDNNILCKPSHRLPI